MKIVARDGEFVAVVMSRYQLALIASVTGRNTSDLNETNAREYWEERAVVCPTAPKDYNSFNLYHETRAILDERKP